MRGMAGAESRPPLQAVQAGRLPLDTARTKIVPCEITLVLHEERAALEA